MKSLCLKAREELETGEYDDEDFSQFELIEFFTWKYGEDIKSIEGLLRKNMTKGNLHFFYQKLVRFGWIPVDEKLIKDSIRYIVENDGLFHCSRSQLTQIFENIVEHDWDAYVEKHQVLFNIREDKIEGRIICPERVFMKSNYEDVDNSGRFICFHQLSKEFIERVKKFIESKKDFIEIEEDNRRITLSRKKDNKIILRTITKSLDDYASDCSYYEEFCSTMLRNINAYLSGDLMHWDYNRLMTFISDGFHSEHRSINGLNNKEFREKFNDRLKD